MLNALLGVAGSFLGGGGGGGLLSGGTPSPPPAPIDTKNEATFGAVTFGNKYIGDTAVKQSATNEAIAAGGVARWLPWAIGGLVAIVALIVFGRSRPAKK